MPVMQSPPGAETVIDGRRYLYFAGTGYLGLQGHPEVIRAACEATREFGIGSATSRTGFGNTPPVLEVERRCAEFFALEDAFYFASGYMGNNILVLMLEGSFDCVFVDELSHYCVFEAARLSGRPVSRFRHGDAADLGAKLKAKVDSGQRPLVISDGVFAARGTIAPVAEYRAVLNDHPGSVLLIDDAHGLGVLGAGGRGTLEHAGVFDSRVNADADAASGPRLLLCGTLSKAVGGFGGIIPGTRRFIERLKATSHYYGGASAPPVPAAAATARALELIASDPNMRTRLWRNVAALKDGLRRMGLEADDTPVPIVCLTIGEAENMQRIQRELMQRGIAIAYLAAYAGLGPQGALRLAVFSTHTAAMIEQLLDELPRLL
jgi:7-keto-8-aminopelargonate synthetase-like enzyme